MRTRIAEIPALGILGPLTMLTAAFMGCGGGDGAFPIVQKVEIRSSVLNCGEAPSGLMEVIFSANGEPMLVPGSAVNYPNSNTYPPGEFGHLFLFSVSIPTQASPEYSSSFDLTYSVKDDKSPAASSWGYSTYAFQADVLVFHPLDANLAPTGLRVRPLLKKVDFGAESGTAGIGHVVFDCANPNPTTLSLGIQLTNAIAKEKLERTMKSLRGAAALSFGSVSEAEEKNGAAPKKTDSQPMLSSSAKKLAI